MDVVSKDSSATAGFAMLLGPNFSIVLQKTVTVLGRGHSSTKSSSKCTGAHSKSGATKQLRHGSSKPDLISSTKSTQPKEGKSSSSELSTSSPLYWRQQWAKQQVSSNAARSSSHFDHGHNTRSQLDTMSLYDLDTSLSVNNSVMEDKDGESLPTTTTTNLMDLDLPRSTTLSISTTLTSEKPQVPAVKPTIGPSKLDTSNSAAPTHSMISSLTTIDGNTRLKPQERPNCDIDLGPDPLISHYHATISYDSDLMIWDISCHSRNGLQLNGRPLYPSDGPALLSSKSRLQIGSVLFLFLLPLKPEKKHSGTSDGSSSTPFAASNKAIEGLITDEESAPAAVIEEPQSNPKKRKTSDRSIVPLRLIELLDESDRKKRRFSQHISRRANSLRSIVSGLSSSDVHQQWQGELESEDVLMPHLSATYNPRLEEYNENDRRSRYSSAGIASAAFNKDADSATDSARITPKPGGGRGPRSGKPDARPTVGYDASGALLERPKLKYGQLISMAIESSADKRMVFPEITDWIVRNFPYFTTSAAGNWHNSVRHQLSNTPDFVRHERTKEMGKGKGGLWALARWYNGDQLLTRPRH